MVEIALLGSRRADSVHDELHGLDDSRLTVEVDRDLFAASHKVRRLHGICTHLDMPGSAERDGGRAGLADADRPEKAVDSHGVGIVIPGVLRRLRSHLGTEPASWSGRACTVIRRTIGRRRSRRGSRSLDTDSIETVDASSVVAPLVVSDALFALFVRPRVESRAMVIEAHYRHSVTTRVRDARKAGDNDRSGADSNRMGKISRKFAELTVLAQNNRSGSLKSDYSRCSRKCAEHQRDSTILLEMRDGFDPAPGLIKIGNATLVDDGKLAPVPLGGAVHMPLCIEWSSCDKKDRLCEEPGGEFFRDAAVE